MAARKSPAVVIGFGKYIYFAVVGVPGLIVRL
jgi:hypothetical protein